MSEQVQAGFKSIAEFIEHLNGLGSETVNVAYVTEQLALISARPAKSGVRRGQLAGLSLEDMTDEQLKREKINASSVLYKAKQRNAEQSTIDNNQARVDAVDAALRARGLTKVSTPASDDPAAGDMPTAEVNEETAAEI